MLLFAHEIPLVGFFVRGKGIKLKRMKGE